MIFYIYSLKNFSIPRNSWIPRKNLGGLNLAIKRAKPNKGGTGSSCGPETQEEVVLKKAEKKKENGKKTQEKTATSTSQRGVENRKTNKDASSSSTPRNQQKDKLKKVDMSTKTENTLDSFQNWNLAPEE